MFGKAIDGDYSFYIEISDCIVKIDRITDSIFKLVKT